MKVKTIIYNLSKNYILEIVYLIKTILSFIVIGKNTAFQ